MKLVVKYLQCRERDYLVAKVRAVRWLSIAIYAIINCHRIIEFFNFAMLIILSLLSLIQIYVIISLSHLFLLFESDIN